MNPPTRKHFVYASIVAVAVGCAYAPTPDVESGTSGPSTTTFCNEFVASAKKCGQPGNTASCLTSAARYSEAELAAATACTEKPCDDVQACIDAALGKLSTTPDEPLADAGADASRHDAGAVTPKDAGGPVAETCTGFGKSSTCRACQEQQCCSEMAACRNLKNCSDFLDCCASMTCANGDLTCLNAQCKFAHDEDAVYAFNAWVDCRDQKCTDECPGKPYW